MKEWKNKTFSQALLHAMDGIKSAFKSEKNLKIQSVFGVLAIAIGILLKLNLIEFGILILTIFIVLVTEMLNTAIEFVLDLYTEKYNEKVKVAKDIASGAVLVTSIMSIIIGGILFLPKLI